MTSDQRIFLERKMIRRDFSDESVDAIKAALAEIDELNKKLAEEKTLSLYRKRDMDVLAVGNMELRTKNKEATDASHADRQENRALRTMIEEKEKTLTYACKIIEEKKASLLQLNQYVDDLKGKLDSMYSAELYNESQRNADALGEQCKIKDDTIYRMTVETGKLTKRIAEVVSHKDYGAQHCRDVEMLCSELTAVRISSGDIIERQKKEIECLSRDQDRQAKTISSLRDRLAQKFAAHPETAAIAEIHNRLAKLEKSAKDTEISFERVWLHFVSPKEGSVLGQNYATVKKIGDDVTTILENKYIRNIMAY